MDNSDRVAAFDAYSTFPNLKATRLHAITNSLESKVYEPEGLDGNLQLWGAFTAGLQIQLKILEHLIEFSKVESPQIVSFRKEDIKKIMSNILDFEDSFKKIIIPLLEKQFELLGDLDKELELVEDIGELYNTEHSSTLTLVSKVQMDIFQKPLKDSEFVSNFTLRIGLTIDEINKRINNLTDRLK